MIKIGIVGAGIISVSHIEAIRENPDCQLVAIADIVPERAKVLAEGEDAAWYTDYRIMAQQEALDAVIINLPHYLHMECSIFFLERKVSVLVEKPMANTVEECEKMQAAADKNNVKLAVAHIQRFFDTTEFVKKYIDEQTFGPLCMFTEVRNLFYFNSSRPKWFLDKNQSGGGILMNYMAHTLDKLFYLLGNTLVEVHGSYANLLDGYNVEGNAQVFLKMKDNISACVTFCGYDVPSDHEVAYYFKNGIIKVRSSNTLLISEGGKFNKLEILQIVKPFAKQLKAFVSLLNGGESNMADYAKDIIGVIQKIYG